MTSERSASKRPDSERTNSLVHPDSLGDTLDALNAAWFDGCEISLVEREAAAAWLADRQGLPGAYAGMFAPTGYDYAFGALTFTGEPVPSKAGAAHLLSEETCRALYRLGPHEDEVRGALKRARLAIFHRLEQSEVKGQWSGVYCCGMCSVSLWRHLSASGEPEDVRRIENGLAELHRYRDGAGRWKRFPFYYTLLALSEIDHPAVLAEIEYAEKVIERSLRRLLMAEPEELSRHDRRRAQVMQRALERL